MEIQDIKITHITQLQVGKKNPIKMDKIFLSKHRQGKYNSGK